MAFQGMIYYCGTLIQAMFQVATIVALALVIGTIVIELTSKTSKTSKKLRAFVTGDWRSSPRVAELQEFLGNEVEVIELSPTDEAKFDALRTFQMASETVASPPKTGYTLCMSFGRGSCQGAVIDNSTGTVSKTYDVQKGVQLPIEPTDENPNPPAPDNSHIDTLFLQTFTDFEIGNVFCTGAGWYEARRKGCPVVPNKTTVESHPATFCKDFDQFSQTLGLPDYENIPCFFLREIILTNGAIRKPCPLPFDDGIAVDIGTGKVAVVDLTTGVQLTMKKFADTKAVEPYDYSNWKDNNDTFLRVVQIIKASINLAVKPKTE